MIQEYVARITGDVSGLKKAIKESKGDLKSIGDNEYIIKIGYDGNPKELNKKLQEIAKSSPELAIQFQYNVNQKALNQELDKLKNLQELKLDIETDGANKKITGMISELAKAVKTDTSEDIIEAKIKGIYKYANTISELGGKISEDLSGGIYNAISGTKFEVIFDKLLEKTDTSKLRLFNFKKPLDDEITATEQRIGEFKSYIDDLEKRGASKGGMSSELQQLQDEVKILRSDLSDMKKELGSISGEKFNKLADDIKDVNAQLQIALDKIATLSGENSLGNVIQKWQKDDITKTNERYTAFNSKTMQTSGEHVAASASGVSEELIRKSIEEMAGEADGFIHSHPEKYAAFSDNDIVSYFKLFNEGITKQILTSYNQVLSLDMSAINTDYQDEIIQRIKQRFSEIEDIEVYQKNIFQYVDSLKQALQDGLNSDVAKLLPTDVINTFKKKYGDFLSSVGEDFTADDLFNGIDQVVSDTLKESSSYISGSNELKKNIRQNLIGITPHLLGTVNDYLHDQQQLMFQEELMSVFSNPKYLREGIESAIKLQDVDDFVKDAQEAGGKIGRGIVEGFRKGIDAHSNSKEAERAVDDFANGVVDEFEKRTDDMVQAAKKAGDAVTEAFNDSIKDSFDELDEVYAREAESRDSMQGYDTPLYSEADIDRIYSRHDDEITGYLHDIENLQEELDDAEADNRDLIEENRELRRKLSNSKLLSPIEQFYKDYGTPSHAMDMGYNVDEVLRILGGRFADIDPNAEDYSEQKLDAEFFKELIKNANLAEDELEVVKAALIDIDDYAEGGRSRHLLGNEFTANELVSNRLKLIKEIIDGEHEITELEKSNAKSTLKYAQERHDIENKHYLTDEDEDPWAEFWVNEVQDAHDNIEEITEDVSEYKKDIEDISETPIIASEDEKLNSIKSLRDGLIKIIDLKKEAQSIDVNDNFIDQDSVVSETKNLNNQLDSVSKNEVELGSSGKFATEQVKKGLTELEEELDTIAKKSEEIYQEYLPLYERASTDQASSMSQDEVQRYFQLDEELSRLSDKESEIKKQIQELRFDKVTSSVSEAVGVTEIWYRRIHDISEILQTTGAFFADTLKLASTYFSNGDRLVAGKIDKSNFLTVDAKGKRWNDLYEISDDLEKQLLQNGGNPDEYLDPGHNVYKGNTKYISQLARALGYLGVEIKNVIDTGGNNQYGDFIGNILQVFDKDLVSNVYDVTDAFLGLSDSIAKVEKVSQVKLRLDEMIRSQGNGDFTEEEKNIYQQLFGNSDVLSGEYDFNSLFGQVVGIKDRLKGELRDTLIEESQNLMQSLKLGNITLDDFLARYKDMIVKYQTIISQSSTIPSGTTALSQIDEVTDNIVEFKKKQEETINPDLRNGYERMADSISELGSEYKESEKFATEFLHAIQEVQNIHKLPVLDNSQSNRMQEIYEQFPEVLEFFAKFPQYMTGWIDEDSIDDWFTFLETLPKAKEFLKVQEQISDFADYDERVHNGGIHFDDEYLEEINQQLQQATGKEENFIEKYKEIIDLFSSGQIGEIQAIKSILEKEIPYYNYYVSEDTGFIKGIPKTRKEIEELGLSAEETSHIIEELYGKTGQLKTKSNEKVIDASHLFGRSSNENDLSSVSDKIEDQARAEMQAEEDAYDAAKRAEVEAERAGEAIVESQDKVQKELLDTASILEELNKLVSPTKIESSKNIQGFNDSLGGLFGDNKSFEKTLRSSKEWLKTFIEVKKNGSRTIGNYGAISGITDAQFIENQNSIAQKLGYNIKWNTDDQGYLHGIVSESENAVKSLDEVFERMLNINELVAKSNETPVLSQEHIVQNQNDIQEEMRETVDEIDTLIEKEKEMSSIQLPAVIPLIDNQAQAREAFNKDVRSELFTDGNAKQGGELIEYEAKALDVLDKNAEDAAESKNKFATANIVVLKSIIDSVAGLDNEGNAFKELNKLITDFANADDESIRHIADNIKILRDALNEHIDDNSLLNALKELSQQGVNLKDLGASIKNAKKQVESNTKNAINPAKFETDIDDQIRKIDYLLDKGQYVEGFKEKLDALRKSLDDLSDAGASDESVKKLKEITREISDFSRQATLAENKATNGKSISKLLGQINDILSKNTSAKFKRTNVYKDLIDYQAQLKSFDASRPKAEFNELSDAVLRTIAEFKELDQTTRGGGFLGRVSNRLADLNAKFFAQYLSFHDLIRYARTAITTIIDLDTQLVDLRKTTKMNDTELEEFYKNSSNVAKQLGVTTSEIISQASAWSRLGYNTKETSTEMAKLSSQFASISPGMTTDEAQTGLVSIMKAWDVDVSKVSRDIMDNINTLGNNFALTNKDIIDGMERAGATLSAIGTSVQDSFALFTGAQEVLQNAETVGTALKTLSLRIRGYDEETEELSEDVIEATGKVADLTKVASNNFAGVSLWADAAQTKYRSLKDYLGDIAEILDEIDAKSRTDLLERLFGKRGASVGSAILGNFDQVEKAIEAMDEAAGSSDREMGIIRDKQNCPYVQQCA